MMSKILNFNEFKSGVDKNREFAEKFVQKVENLLETDLKNERGEIEDNENHNNFMFLMNNFRNINDFFKKGFVTPEELQLIQDKLYLILKDEDYSLSRIYIILCFYNAYRIYNKKFIMLSANDVVLITNLFVSFEQCYDVKTLDGISNFIFDEQIMGELKNVTSNSTELFRRCESIVDAFLNDDISAPVEYYAKQEIKLLKAATELEANYGPGFLGYGIRTPKFIQKRLEEQLNKMAFMLSDETYLGLKSDVDMLEFKINNMTKKAQQSFYKHIAKIDFEEEINPLEKLERILNVADFLCCSNTIGSEDEGKKAK